ncbi:mechanosensitive ion channel family protein [Rufibacter quisquiliarum]|uniref:Small-conductance mechanosensitive channel n=1 Tax=Rufibacter quisquiliarum TaxID=1549639 RepID=A0A839GPW6_9BACT|nr:mechanosensitive ion channel family protein [Rufibacter quisquiliarum]MBA9075881.1 small-conductance mechanosensitive channel [Rufibacter quisquiliarum]
MWGKLERWLKQIVLMLPELFLATVVLILSFLVARLARRASDKLLIRFTHSSSLNNLVGTTVYVATLALGIFFTLSILKLDKTVTTLLAGAGIIGLALGFAFQDIAANFISGVIIAIRKPFVVGDVIDTNEHFGTIERINLRTVDIRRQTGELVKMPNRKVFESALINYSHYGIRRIDLKVGVSYAEDLERVQQVVKAAMVDIPNMISGKEVEVVYEEFGDSSINFLVRYWIQYKRQTDFVYAKSEAIMRIKKAFDQHNIEIPFPIRTLNFGVKGGKDLSIQLKEALPQLSQPAEAEEGAGAPLSPSATGGDRDKAKAAEE